MLVADDHHTFRNLLGNSLLMVSDIEIVGEAADGEEAIKLADSREPDVILMDITMPVIRLRDGLRKNILAHGSLGSRCILDPEFMESMAQAGAVEYFCKDASLMDLLKAIRGTAD